MSLIADRATQLYQCAACSAELDHPGAECPACLHDPARELELALGPMDPSAAELDLALHFHLAAEDRRRDELPEPRLAGVQGAAAELLVALVGTAGAALVIVWLFTDTHQVNALLVTWKAAAWSWLTADLWTTAMGVLVALLVLVTALAVRRALGGRHV